MNKVQQILGFLIQTEKVSGNELGKETGVPQPVINRIINGKTLNPSISTLIPIAKYFNLSMSQLIGEAPLPEVFNKQLAPSEDISFANETHNVPIIHWNQILEWCDNTLDASVEEYISIEKQTSRKIFALKMNELDVNITNPRFHSDSIIIIEPEITTLNYDYVIICNVEKTLPPKYYISQILFDDSKKILKSLTSNEETYPMKTTEKIIGIIIEARHHYVDFAINNRLLDLNSESQNEKD